MSCPIKHAKIYVYADDTTSSCHGKNLEEISIYTYKILIKTYKHTYIKVNSNTIELTMQTSCYWVLDLLCVTKFNPYSHFASLNYIFLFSVKFIFDCILRCISSFADVGGGETGSMYVLS